ncbi:MAG: anthranilate synthase component I [Gemmatimonadota bacterium]|nr:anthranilate synthase component I [Gemmatimonadota bacterium]MDE2984035.1 anthranilate synthase component I [Gemmatimonadota bacterium]
MNVEPTFESFLEGAAPGSRIPVWCEFLFDSDTAVTAYHKLRGGTFGFLLESVVGGEQWARYSFLGSRPREAWMLEGSDVSVWCPEHGWRPHPTDEPLADLHARLTEARPRPDPRLPRFWGGAVGYFGYDLVRRMERLGSGPPDDHGLPTAMVMFSDVVIAVDNLHGRARAITTLKIGNATDRGALKLLYREAVGRLAEVVEELRSGSVPAPLPLEPGTNAADIACDSNFDRDDFVAGVRRIQDYIAAGDAFQVVLSQRLTTRFEQDPFDLYRALRTINPSPYLYFLELDGLGIVGSSPEVLVRMEDGVVTVRPIAGTRRRGDTPAEDRDLAEELVRDEKELAEHRMLVDLGRNDVGRVSEYGSVTVPELMAVERYSHVMHLCSQVEGRVRKGLTALDVLAACFPAGTVSGAPKVRAMEIIDELEPTARGPYAGAVGHLGWGGAQMDTAIAIRTMIVRDGRAHVQAGAGVVADSDPEAEFNETMNKARALLHAVWMVGRSQE